MRVFYVLYDIRTRTFIRDSMFGGYAYSLRAAKKFKSRSAAIRYRDDISRVEFINMYEPKMIERL